MFKEIASTIRLDIMNLGFHDTYHALATRHTWEGKLTPMVYNGDGHLEQIMILEGSSGYTRKEGKVAIREVTDEREHFTSCITSEYIMEMNIPLRIVSWIPREDFSCEDSYTDEVHVAEILNAVSGKPAGLATEISAREVRVLPSGTTTNSEEVWSQEVPGSNYVPPKELSLVSVDIIVKVKLDKDCLVAACQY